MIEPFDSEVGYRAAIDVVIEAATRELRIFDGNLERMALDEAARSALLLEFLKGGTGRHLKLILHDVDRMRTQNPRLINLLRRQGHLIEVRQTPDHLRHLADCFVLADELHGTVRFHADHARGKYVRADRIEIHPLWQRFDDLWNESQLCTPASASGL
jgi:hypothetical protein